MKKIKIFSIICLISTLGFSQTYSSGLVNIIGSLSAEIDINTSTDLVTLTLIGPESGWLAMAFNDDFGHDGADVVMFDGTDLQDRTFTNNLGEPDLDTSGQDDWTVTSNTIAGGLRTVVATRSRVSADANDYDFPATPTSLNIIGAYNGSFNMNNKHDDYDFATLNFSLLGIEDVNQLNFSMLPNPTSTNLKIVLPSNLTNSTIEVFDISSRKIFESKIRNSRFSMIDVSTWYGGVYFVKVSSNNSHSTKRFIKQ